LALVGSGDMGETVELPDGRICRRLKGRHKKRLVAIFGEFVLHRVVYGNREDQRIGFVPVDSSMQLPDSGRAQKRNCTLFPCNHGWQALRSPK